MFCEFLTWREFGEEDSGYSVPPSDILGDPLSPVLPAELDAAPPPPPSSITLRSSLARSDLALSLSLSLLVEVEPAAEGVGDWGSEGGRLRGVAGAAAAAVVAGGVEEAEGTRGGGLVEEEEGVVVAATAGGEADVGGRGRREEEEEEVGRGGRLATWDAGRLGSGGGGWVGFCGLAAAMGEGEEEDGLLRRLAWGRARREAMVAVAEEEEEVGIEGGGGAATGTEEEGN